MTRHRFPVVVGGMDGIQRPPGPPAQTDEIVRALRETLERAEKGELANVAIVGEAYDDEDPLYIDSSFDNYHDDIGMFLRAATRSSILANDTRPEREFRKGDSGDETKAP